MSVTTTYTGGILETQFDYAKLFIWNNRYITGTYTNGSGSTQTLAPGTVMGVIASSGKVTPQVSTAIDGSQVPRYILRSNVVVLNTASATVSLCYVGDVDASLIILGGSDTLNTQITLNDSAGTPNTTVIGTIGALLLDRSINPVTTIQNTIADN